jgi:nicotinamide-nucleotide adenylyltransferase
MKREDIYDLARLFALHEAVTTLALIAQPATHLLHPQAAEETRHIGILCGSFNPLTRAHTELAHTVRRAFALDRVCFTLGTVTIDKTRVSGLALVDRLLLLSLYALRHEGMGVALVNRGLYFEQAQAFRSRYGALTQLSFVIGMDKLVQIFDPRYYENREAALQALFALASLIVANREDMEQDAFTQLLDQPENRPYRSHVQFVSLPDTVAEVSATAVRQACAAGQDVHAQVPVETAMFLAETHPYDSLRTSNNEAVDIYALRFSLLERLFTVRTWAERSVDFQHLVQDALRPGARGQALRRAASGTELMQLIHS